MNKNTAALQAPSSFAVGELEQPKLKFLGKDRQRNLLLVLAFAVSAMLTMGYHPGIEDDGIYLSAVKRDLNPALFPRDSEFFRLQSQATLFDKGMAAFIRLTHMPVPAAELLFQFISIVLIILGCWSIARTLFEDERVQWAGVAMTAAMLTLPVSGTALYIADQHLHPRNLATGLILLAVSRILRERLWQAVCLLLVSVVLHPIMGAFGISFCFFLTTARLEPVHVWLRSLRGSPAAAVPLGWIFEAPTPTWHRALQTRKYFFLYKWKWYEWLGALGPLFLFGILWRFALKRRETILARFSLAVFAYGVFQQALAMIVLKSPALVRLTPLQPMRYLHLIYCFLTLIGGCLIGRYLLKSSGWRWAVYLLLINAGMFASQRALFASSPHLELPGRQATNPWLRAFAWIRVNTPIDAYFAMDPYYLAAPGEDHHSFRALAERSQLADMVKDTAVVTQVPELGPDWQRQVDAAQGWHSFKLPDFERLKNEFGVDWVLLDDPPPAGLTCHWHEQPVYVCEVP